MRFRTWNHFRAALLGYFWAPCTLCGQMYGGHEWRDYDGKSSSIETDRPGISQGICPDCTRAGRGTWFWQRPGWVEEVARIEQMSWVRSLMLPPDVSPPCLDGDADDPFPELWEGDSGGQVVTGILLSRDDWAAVLEDEDGTRWQVDPGTLQRQEW